MTISEFRSSLSADFPPASLGIYLQALWYDAKGDWHKAHAQVDSLSDATASWVHAYLHRKEGDQWNADYWYRRAGKKSPALTLDEEWNSLATALL